MEEKREYCVYKHTSKIDGRAYVGITRVGVENRWRNGGIGYKNQKYFWHYVEKYGWDSLEHEVLFDNLTEEEATTMEKELIAKWDLTNRNKGFNLDLGGSTNNRFWKGVYCVETDKEYEGTRIAERETGIPASTICACCSGKRSFAGKDDNGNPLHWVYSDEKNLVSQRLEEVENKRTKNAISVYNIDGNLIAHYDTPRDAANQTGRDINNIRSDCLRPHRYQDGKIWIYDRDFSEEELLRRIEIATESYPWEKKVYQYSMLGEFVAEYDTAIQAQEVTEVNNSDIGMACKGKYGSVGGYIWRYEKVDLTIDELKDVWSVSKYKPVVQYDNEMNIVAEYNSLEEVGFECPNYSSRTVSACCHRRFDFAYGYIWRFKGETQEQYDADKEYYKNKKPSPKGNRIVQYTTDGRIVKVFDSFADVEKDGWGRNMVSLCCRGKKDIYRGYIWKYAE